MITNLVIVSISLLTNSQSAIVGESNGKALVASQETVIQRKVFLEDVVLSNAVTTNAVGFAFRTPTNSPSSTTNAASSHTKPALSPTNATPPAINTNSPAYRHKLIQEQRMKAATNAPPKQTK